MLAGPCRFDRCIERQEVRLIGDILDRRNNLADDARAFFERDHRGGRLVCAVAKITHRFARGRNRRFAGARFRRCAASRGGERASAGGQHDDLFIERAERIGR